MPLLGPLEYVRVLQVSLLQGGILQVRLFTTMPLTS